MRARPRCSPRPRPRRSCWVPARRQRRLATARRSTRNRARRAPAARSASAPAIPRRRPVTTTTRPGRAGHHRQPRLPGRRLDHRVDLLPLLRRRLRRAEPARMGRDGRRRHGPPDRRRRAEPAGPPRRRRPGDGGPDRSQRRHRPHELQGTARSAHRAGARRPPDLPADELPVREGPGPDERRAPAGGGGRRHGWAGRPHRAGRLEHRRLRGEGRHPPGRAPPHVHRPGGPGRHHRRRPSAWPRAPPPPTTTTTVASDSTASRRGTSSTKTTTASSATCTTERAGSTSGGSGSGNRGSGGSGSGGPARLRRQRQDDDHGAPAPAPTTSPGSSPSGTDAPPTSKPGKPGSTTAPPGTTHPARTRRAPTRRAPARRGRARRPPEAGRVPPLLGRVSSSGSVGRGQWSSTQGAHSPSRSRISMRSRFS